MSTAPRYIPRYTLDDYNRWEGDWELIDGVAVSMSPSPFGPHERVVTELSRQIANQIIEKRCQCRAYANLDWIVDNHTVIRPDLMVVCGEQPQRHLQRPPVVMVEVLTDATRERDLTVKRTLCLENDVAHYLILDPSDRSILHVTGNDEAAVDTTQPQTLRLDDQCEIALDCTKLFQ
ncbi:Uma2 family endonuclease [Novipirellula maiorica]|uniref:Uma2 family endonuclease n=1 Tax=Novipirellula maiorica TaxID=1265734 RepID=UPI000347B0FD|nr:Uma2 family endonuclease [Rhodopirellula maiorica]